MVLKPFDLRDALTGVAECYTKAGNRVTCLSLFTIPNTTYVLYGLIEGENKLTSFNMAGRFSEAKECGKDLVLKY